jgi:hypothetical protein
VERAARLEGEAEVEQLGVLVPLDEDARGREGAVDEAARVDHAQCRRDVLADRADERLGERAALEALGELLALEQLHDDVGRPVVVTDGEDLDEVRAVLAREGRSFEPEAVPVLGGQLAVEAAGDLDAERLAVADRAVHDAGRTPADLVLELQTRELGQPAGVTHRREISPGRS